MSCRKVGYATAGEAREASRQMSKAKGGRLRVYRCRECEDAYHLTSWTKADERIHRKHLREQDQTNFEEAS